MEAQGDVARRGVNSFIMLVLVVSLMVYLLQVVLLCIYLKYIFNHLKEHFLTHKHLKKIHELNT
jgi:hypothetical protein